MKSAQEILASLSPVERDLAINPYTAAEVRRIAADERLTTFDRATLSIHADQLHLSATWWCERFIANPDTTAEAVEQRAALDAVPMWVRNWLTLAQGADDQAEASKKRIAALQEKLAAEQLKLEDAAGVAQRFRALYYAAPEVPIFGKAYELYWQKRDSLRKPVNPSTPASGN